MGLWLCNLEIDGSALYRVIGIQKDILVEYGVHLSYKQDWMGRKVAMLVIHASEVTSYDLLLQYLSNVPETNFGNVVLLRIIGSDLNELFFFSLCACLLGFKKGCKPLLFLNGTHMLGNYGLIQLGMIGKDDNEGLFHVALVVIDSETEGN